MDYREHNRRMFARRHMKDTTAKALGVLLGLGIFGFIVWFHLNYKCIRSHKEWRSDCDVTRDSYGRKVSESCWTRQVDVCDEYVER